MPIPLDEGNERFYCSVPERGWAVAQLPYRAEVERGPGSLSYPAPESQER